MLDAVVANAQFPPELLNPRLARFRAAVVNHDYFKLVSWVVQRADSIHAASQVFRTIEGWDDDGKNAPVHDIAPSGRYIILQPPRRGFLQ
jgi:hypothetical protein